MKISDFFWPYILAYHIDIMCTTALRTREFKNVIKRRVHPFTLTCFSPNYHNLVTYLMEIAFEQILEWIISFRLF